LTHSFEGERVAHAPAGFKGKKKREQQQEQEDHSEGLADFIQVSLPLLHRGVCVQAERTKRKTKKGVWE
jgi:hypothetical protein